MLYLFFLLLWVLVLNIYTVVADAEFSGRVVNGTDAESGEFPFVASLRPPSGEHMCGCTILNEYWILTAAHCVHYRRPPTINVQYGVTSISIDGPKIGYGSEVIVHEAYSPENFYENDIAVVRLMEPIVFDRFVQPVKLPVNMDEVPPDCNSTLIGWGKEMTGGTIQSHLKKASLKVFSYEECQARHNGRIHKSNICAGVPEGGRGQCNGDSGGPLLYMGQQIGIVSWSEKPCSVALYPGVYTKVAYYVAWIRDKVGKTY